MSLADELVQHPQAVWEPRPSVLAMDRLPLPMHGMAPRVVLGSRWWDQTRQAAYRSTNFHCVACSVSRFSTDWCQWLEGHEVYGVDHLLGRMTYLETVPLCQRCHKYVHQGYARILVEQGHLTWVEFDQMVDHGDRVLRGAGLERPRPYTGPSVEWHEWRLVLDGTEYPPLYSTYEQYLTEHGR